MSSSRDKENEPERILADLKAKAIKSEQENAEAKRKIDALEQKRQEASVQEPKEEQKIPVDLISISKQIEDIGKIAGFLKMDIDKIYKAIEEVKTSVSQNESSIGVVNGKIAGIIETAKISDSKITLMETSISQASQSIANVSPQFIEVKNLIKESNSQVEDVNGKLAGFQNSITRIDEILKSLKPAEKKDNTQEDPLKNLQIEEPDVG